MSQTPAAALSRPTIFRELSFRYVAGLLLCLVFQRPKRLAILWPSRTFVQKWEILIDSRKRVKADFLVRAGHRNKPSRSVNHGR